MDGEAAHSCHRAEHIEFAVRGFDWCETRKAAIPVFGPVDRGDAFCGCLYNMINGKEIDKTQLDWFDQAKKGNARVLKADMRYTMADEV